jgi:hypothetical protein
MKLDLFITAWTILLFVIASWVLVIRPVIRSAEYTFAKYHAGAVQAWERFRTLAIAKLFMLLSAVVALVDFLSPIAMGVDWSPLTAKAPAWTLPVVMFVMAAIFAYMRKITNKAPGRTAPIIGEEEKP